MAELRRRGVANSHTLAYQSRVGPVEWLRPYTDDSIRCGEGAGGAKEHAAWRGVLVANLAARLAPQQGKVSFLSCCLLFSQSQQQSLQLGWFLAPSLLACQPTCMRPIAAPSSAAGSWRGTACAACWRCPSPLSASTSRRWRRLTASTGTPAAAAAVGGAAVAALQMLLSGLLVGGAAAQLPVPVAGAAQATATAWRPCGQPSRWRPVCQCEKAAASASPAAHLPPPHACLRLHPPLTPPRSELAESVGIEHWGRVPALNTNE